MSSSVSHPSPENSGLIDYARLFEPPHAEPAEHLARDVFTALMWALSYPGTPYPLPASLDQVSVMGSRSTEPDLAAHLAIATALLDLETSFYTPHAELGELLARTSARPLGPAEAAYHFYPTRFDAGSTPQAEEPTPWVVIEQRLLADVGVAHTGDFLYPDRSATLVIGCRFDQGTKLTLQGPGIQGQSTIRASLPPAFWQLRTETLHYPLGWDLFLTDGAQVVGLPRSTAIAWAPQD